VTKVYITGLGIVSPIGAGVEAFLAALRAGRSGLGPLHGIDTGGFRIGRGGEVDDASFVSDGIDSSDQRAFVMALGACRQALDDAGIDATSLPANAALALGSGAGEMRAMERTMGPREGALPLDDADPIQAPNAVTSKLARRLAMRGRLLTFINACAAGAQAIAMATDLVRSGRAPVALAGGVEVMSRMVLSGFEALRAVSPTGPRPFDAGRDGIQLSEMAAFVVLENEARVRERGVRPYALVSGSGASADAVHVVRPDGDGEGAALALRRALDNAGLAPGEVDYVNAHGTGTPQNDPAELAALRSVFGEGLPPISSTKGLLGHALGASGAAEAVICALSLRHGFLAPTTGWETPIASYEDVDVVHNVARQGVQLRHAVSSAFAFGGNNVVLVLSNPGDWA
jgi:3-oxoacyl-[acyl-carrier-protein] synthase II